MPPLKDVREEMEDYMKKEDKLLTNGSLFEDIEYEIKQLEKANPSEEEVLASIGNGKGDTSLANIYGILLNCKIALQQLNRFHELTIKRTENYSARDNTPLIQPPIGEPPIK